MNARKIGKMEAIPDPLERAVATKMLLSYDYGEEHWKSGLNSAVIAKDHFVSLLTEEEVTLPFTRMVLTFSPILHWNDLADVCMWVLGLHDWSGWMEYKKGLESNKEE